MITVDMLRRASAALRRHHAQTPYTVWVHPTVARQVGRLASGWPARPMPRSRSMRRRRRVLAVFGHERRPPPVWQGVKVVIKG